MIKNLIIFLLLTNVLFTVSLKSGQITFDEEIEYNEDNSQFNFENEGEETAYFLMKINPTKDVKVKYTCGGTGRTETFIELLSIGLKLEKGQTCNIQLSPNEEGAELKGKIMVHPLSSEIPVDLTKKTEYKGHAQSYEACTPLVYSVTNVTEDVKFKFEYVETKISIAGGDSFTLSNPFQVCGDKCENNVKTYKFSKGKDYKINIKFEGKEVGSSTLYFFPAFSFEKTNKGDNIKLSLISLLLLLKC